MLVEWVANAWRFFRELPSLEFHEPRWVILLSLPAIAALWWRHASGRANAAIAFPTVSRLKGFRPTLRQRLRWVPPFLESLAVVFLFVALARPRKGDARSVIQSEGIAIQMVLDRSGSMEEPMVYRGRRRPRIDIVKDVFVRFIQGDEVLPGRKTDLVGLTTFARYPEESCPLVGNHGPLVAAVLDLRTVPPALDRYDQPVRDIPRDPAEIQRLGLKANPLNRTAIGDALQYAVASLVTAEENLRRGEDAGGYRLQGKVVILLTDGRNNAGMDPAEAANYAAANGIRIYYVLFMEPYEEEETFWGRKIRREVPRDELLAEPRAVAAPTGGRAYLASDGDELARIYEEIDRLERSKTPKLEYRTYRERYREFLVPAFFFALVAFGLRETVFRSLP